MNKKKAIRIVLSTGQELILVEDVIVDSLAMVFSQFMNPETESVLISFYNRSKIIVMKNQVVTVLLAEVEDDDGEE